MIISNLVREIGEDQLLAPRQRDCPLDGILELANIPWPAVS